MTAKKKPGQKADIQDVVNALEVDLVGVARRRDIKGTRLEKEALKLLPATNSIIVVGMEIYPEFLELTSPERTMGKPDFNRLYIRHTDYLGGRLTGAVYKVARAARKAGFKTLPLPAEGPAVDGRYLEAVISYKHAAAAAGLGNLGMNSLLITEKFGPRVKLALCLTEAELKSTAGEPQKICRYCNVCVLKCPAHALGRPVKDQPYKINQFACRTYIEAAGGCSECVRVCPVASPKYDQ
jgi:epoxyqueuosine reductase